MFPDTYRDVWGRMVLDPKELSTTTKNSGRLLLLLLLFLPIHRVSISDLVRVDSRRIIDMCICRVENNPVWFLKWPHCEAKGEGIYNSGGSSSMLAMLATVLMLCAVPGGPPSA